MKGSTLQNLGSFILLNVQPISNISKGIERRVTTWFYNPRLNSSHYSPNLLLSLKIVLTNSFCFLNFGQLICVQKVWRSSQGMLEIALHSQQCRSSQDPFVSRAQDTVGLSNIWSPGWGNVVSSN